MRDRRRGMRVRRRGMRVRHRGMREHGNLMRERRSPVRDRRSDMRVRRSPMRGVVQIPPMSTAARKYSLDDLVVRTGDPEVHERQRDIVRTFVDLIPGLREELIQWACEEDAFQQGRIDQARESLRLVLRRRGLTPTTEQDARIDACADLGTLRRWLDQAIDAPTADEALQ